MAETIKYNILEDLSSRNSNLMKEARGWLNAYVEEYYTDDFIKKHRYTTSLLREVFAYVKENIQKYWASVDTLANALLQQKTLSEAKAFEIIEREIPEDLKIKAKAELNRTTTEKLAGILKQVKNRKSTTEQPIKKRFSWEFWKK